MATAKQLPSGAWRVQLYAGLNSSGKRQYESFTAPTKAAAELLASQRKVEIEKGIEVVRAPEKMTLGEAIDKYIDERSNVLAPKTIREYKAMRRNYFQGIMDKQLRRLKLSDLQAEINTEALRLSPKTIKNAWNLIRPALLVIDFHGLNNIILPKPKKHEIVIPSDEQMQNIFEYVHELPIEIPVLLAATCGLRRGEIAALDLEKDINYLKNTISISKAVDMNEDGEWIIKAPKTYTSYRTIDAPPWVIEKIKAAVLAGYKMPTANRITSEWQLVCEHNHLKIRFHDLRHYYASLMLKLGIPDLYAMRRMGHATPNMLKTVYQHIMDDKEREISNQLNNYWSNFKP